jgi:hypothetical protein
MKRAAPLKDGDNRFTLDAKGEICRLSCIVSRTGDMGIEQQEDRDL